MANTFLFPKNARISRSNRLLDATIRDYSGGWNVVDNDLNLNTKFSKILENMQRGVDGANVVRPGTKLFAETNAYLDDIINCFYYNGFIVAVGANGQVVSVDSTGFVRSIWSGDWAKNLKGSPTGWSATTFVSFAIFNGELIICNGINKPLIVHSTMVTEYLKDLADDSNVNTPVARYVVAHGRYLVMAGSLTPSEEDQVFISATDISGTWVGDSAPNDAVNVNLGSRIPDGNATIKGLGRFRDKLVVTFENVVLPGTLGVFVGTDHTPTFDDAIVGVGALSHRSLQTLNLDMIFSGFSTVATVKRALFTGSVTTGEASQLINPAYHKIIDSFSSIVTMEDRIWSLWDVSNSNYMLFIPNAESEAQTTEYHCLVYKKNDKLKIESWQHWRNWKFKSGCRSALNSIFLTEGTQVYLLGETTDEKDALTKDFIGDQEMFDDETVFSDYTGFTPVANVADSGIPIRFIWELPWSDNGNRFLTKNSRFINFDTFGSNKFTVSMFTDNIYLDASDFGEDWEEDALKFDDGFGFDVDVLDPTLSMEFTAGDGPGFGHQPYGNNFGGGRPTRLEKLYAWTAKYKLQKSRVEGDATKPLRFVSTTLAYLIGSGRR